MRELVLKIMMILIIHAFGEEKIGWVLLERTLAIAKNCADRGVVDAVSHIHSLCFLLLDVYMFLTEKDHFLARSVL